MPFETILSFLVFAAVAAVTPGPSNAMIAATGAAVGTTRGLPCLAGAAAGMASLIFVAALGLAAAVAAMPGLLTVVRVAGSLLLLWMAWRIATAPPASAAVPAKPIGFAMAAAFQLANPKGWLVAAGAAGAYAAPGQEPRLLQALLLAALFLVVAVPAGFAWLVLGATLQRFAGDPRRGRALNVGMGILLAASVLTLL
jgi:threonine/homoserine/homoserine lactone efflux protein